MAKSKTAHLRPRLIEFKTGFVIHRTRRAMTKAMDKVAGEMQRDIKRKITRAKSPPPSRPGAHPHKDTGFLSDAFTVERRGLRMYLRTPQYGIYLETGTRNMAARPWIHRNIGTLEKNRYWTRRINTEIRRNVAATSERIKPETIRRMIRQKVSIHRSR